MYVYLLVVKFFTNDQWIPCPHLIDLLITTSLVVVVVVVVGVGPPRWDPHRSVRNPLTALGIDGSPVLWFPQRSVWILKNIGNGAIFFFFFCSRWWVGEGGGELEDNDDGGCF